MFVDGLEVDWLLKKYLFILNTSADTFDLELVRVDDAFFRILG